MQFVVNDLLCPKPLWCKLNFYGFNAYYCQGTLNGEQIEECVINFVMVLNIDSGVFSDR
ncbi:MAG: hypothetical protein ACR9NN_20800 [Nostochopsis sp.]